MVRAIKQRSSGDTEKALTDICRVAELSVDVLIVSLDRSILPHRGELVCFQKVLHRILLTLGRLDGSYAKGLQISCQSLKPL